MTKKTPVPPTEPIETLMECPKCKTTIDVSHIKQAIKHRLDQEMDYWLEKL